MTRRLGDAWTPEQERTLKARYGTVPTAVLAAELGRTDEAIRVRANRLGCTLPYHPRTMWTPERVRIVRELYGILQTKQLARQLGCSAAALERQSLRMGLSKPAQAPAMYARDKRTIRRLRILLAVALDMVNTSEAATALGIAPASVRSVLVREAAAGAGECAG